jgi:hypothetical protein
MAFFKSTVDVWLDGEKLTFRTRLDDQLNAERQIHENPANTPIELGSRTWWNAFKRAYPDHPCAKTFGRFAEALERSEEHEPPELDAMDPTREADSDI